MPPLRQGFFQSGDLRERIRFAGFTTLALASVGFAFLVSTSSGHRTILGSELGADFAAFYMAGTLVNSENPGSLYLPDAQAEVYFSLFPFADPDESLPFPYAPFMAIFSSPLAKLPYTTACLVWFALNGVFYLLGVGMLCAAYRPNWPFDTGTTLTASALFVPFLDGWLGGQLPGLIVGCLGLSLWLGSQGKSFWAGMPLAILFYKPTLLVAVIPMLLLTRQWRFLLGTALMAFGLATASMCLIDRGIWNEYASNLLAYAELKRQVPQAFPGPKYVDLNSFLQLVTGYAFSFTTAVAAVFGTGVGLGLSWLWLKQRSDHSRHELAWAAALIWTPLLAPQFGIYDTVIIIPPLLQMIADGASKDGSGNRKSVLLMAVILTAAVTQPIASLSGVQVLTLVLLAVAIFVTNELRTSVTTREELKLDPLSGN